MRLRDDRQSTELSFGQEYVPGLGIVHKLDRTRRWQLAGEYAVTHRLIGPWYRRVCASCATKGQCEYGRWSDDVLVAEVRRERLGQ